MFNRHEIYKRKTAQEVKKNEDEQLSTLIQTQDENKYPLQRPESSNVPIRTFRIQRSLGMSPASVGASLPCSLMKR